MDPIKCLQPRGWDGTDLSSSATWAMTPEVESGLQMRAISLSTRPAEPIVVWLLDRCCASWCCLYYYSTSPPDAMLWSVGHQSLRGFLALTVVRSFYIFLSIDEFRTYLQTIFLVPRSKRTNSNIIELKPIPLSSSQNHAFDNWSLPERNPVPSAQSIYQHRCIVRSGNFA